jgi:hypothetical protein
LASFVGLGVVCTVIWPNAALQLWSRAQSPWSSWLEETPSGSSEGTANNKLANELDALRTELSELREWKEQISGDLTGLLATQQQLQKSWAESMSWYSEPGLLLHSPTITKPRVARSGNGSASARTRPGLQEASAEPRNRTQLEPLPLVRSSASATDTDRNP